MIRRLLRRGIRIGAIVGAIAFLVQIFLRNPAPKRSDTEVKPAPAAAKPKTKASSSATKTAQSKTKAAKKAPAAAWADPVDGDCPSGYPVKVKLTSGIFHVPGGLAYDRTAPDRCYVSAEAAEKDGFRQSKR